jgi:hypothetical protein
MTYLQSNQTQITKRHFKNKISKHADFEVNIFKPNRTFLQGAHLFRDGLPAVIRTAAIG